MPKRPSRAVYWRRRAIVLGTPIGVMVAIALLFLGGHGAKPQQAALTGQATTPSPAAPTSGANTTPPVNTAAGGACAASSIQVTPSVTNGVAGGPVQINLAVATTQSSCSFAMSGSNIAVKINSGNNALWTSQDCPSVIPTGTLSLTSTAPTTVSLSWDGHQSSGSCGATNPWVGPGTYQLIASVIGSTPTTGNFTLTLPNAPTVTQTATPAPSATATPSAPASPTAH